MDPDLLAHLGVLRAASTGQESWPAEQLEALAEFDVLGDVIPHQYGGHPLSGVALTARYEALAAACVETAFVLTQRNGACQRIAASDNDALKARTLPNLATGETFATIGLSHLTTSRQHLGRPAVIAERDDDGWIINGEAPWVTGAAHADWLVIGAATAGGEQILALIAADRPTVATQASADLLGFTSSATATVDLRQVMVPNADLLAGPSERVLHDVKVGGTGSLTTSAVAIGAARASIEGLRVEAAHRRELEPAAGRLIAEHKRLRETLLAAAAGRGDGPGTVQRLRAAANSLVVRAATAWLAASKGTGYLASHPAQRAVREAMFFLVWSCPRSVVLQGIDELSVRNEPLR